MNNKITITVDGQKVRVEHGIMLLNALRTHGMEIPTLCHHPSLSSNGACRLCMVEISHPKWNNWSRLVTSCLYPTEPDLQVSTYSRKVRNIRKVLLELYLAHCPNSNEIRMLAQQEGVDTTPFHKKKDHDNCIMCGLCTRVCQEKGPSAISTLGRGIDKIIGSNFGGFDKKCTGCMACTRICPTNAIESKIENQKITIVNREFEIPVCSVNSENCRGCGVCEEVCPWSIPRVTHTLSNKKNAFISPSACYGCGICAGACPTSAISQKETSDINDLEKILLEPDLSGHTIGFACSRSPFPRSYNNKDIVKVSCIGRVSLEIIVESLVRGADGIVLICRDKDTCPYKAGGDLGYKTSSIAEEIAVLCGLGENRVRCIQPDAGYLGPEKSFLQIKAKSIPSYIRTPFSNSLNRCLGLDGALKNINLLKKQKNLNPVISKSFVHLCRDCDDKSSTTLYLGNLLELDLLVSLFVDEWRVREIIEDGITLLKQLGIRFKISLSEYDIINDTNTEIIVFSSDNLPDSFKNRSVKTLDELAGFGKQGNNRRIVHTGANGFKFRLSDAELKEHNEYIDSLKTPLICSSPLEIAQIKLIGRKGAWQDTHTVHPTMAFIESMKRSEVLFDTVESRGRRIQSHPILPPLKQPFMEFTFNGRPVFARVGEVISSALIAEGISIFGHHHRDGGAQGIFCVNGQCSQCMVIADNKPVKSCMTPVKPGMKVESCEGLPKLKDLKTGGTSCKVEELAVQVLIIGGGPSGICAAIELGKLGVDVLIIDDKQKPGGKLSLQTHNFFGSVADCFAGFRGIDIGHILEDRIAQLNTVKIMTNSTAVGVFSDGKFGIAGNGRYRLITPENVLIAAGAREKSLSFPGCDLTGIYGAGAFQTLTNRDLIHSAKKLFIIGGGNVGLIGAYHALQAGIDVVGLVEALPRCGGYKVHEDKIKRLGVPVKTSHTVLRAEGKEHVEKVITAAVDSSFKPIPGTEESFDVDTVLIAVGLSQVDELYKKSVQYGIKTYAAGDTKEIAEASAAIFSGKIMGRKIACDMGIDVPIPENWERFEEILKHKPGDAITFKPDENKNYLTRGVFPLIRCVQEIPCDPCTKACPKKLITKKGSILSLPEFNGECMGCGQCVLACPGLAISLVFNDYDPTGKKALIMLPFEFDIFNGNDRMLSKKVITTGLEGNPVGKGKIIAIRERSSQNKRKLILLEVPGNEKLEVAGFRIREPKPGKPLTQVETSGDPIVCRCERVRKSEIVKNIRAGIRDMNQLKSATRASLGGCSGKTCKELILKIFREEGIPLSDITMPTIRPLIAEVHLGDFVENTDKEDL